ncbi:hypothetical protein [Streptomyces sp. NPDC094049]|uniref:hypothetical protein n=1 Tax=Streptomyces sp. NPDC094049 TaxID=3154987 RepID=UPI00332B4E95
MTQKLRAASTPLSPVRIRRVLRPAEDRPPLRDRLRWSRIGVVAAESGGTVDRQATYQIRIDLKPELATGERVAVSRTRGARGADG